MLKKLPTGSFVAFRTQALTFVGVHFQQCLDSCLFASDGNWAFPDSLSFCRQVLEEAEIVWGLSVASLFGEVCLGLEMWIVMGVGIMDKLHVTLSGVASWATSLDGCCGFVFVY